MKAVILAGGKGTRIKDFCPDIPKPMIEIQSKPVLQREIEILRREGIKDFIITVGWLCEKITSYLGNGEKFGVNITYLYEKEPLGTGGALLQIESDEDLLVCSGDLVFDFSLEDMLRFHNSHNALATLFAHPSSHIQDSTLICTDNNGAVTSLLTPKERKDGNYQNLTNAGIQIISPELLRACSAKKRSNLDKDIIMPALSGGRIYAYKSAEYVRDMGTPERLARVQSDLESGIVESKNRRKPQKAVFLDRDGTLNKYKGYITSPDQIELCGGAADAVRRINSLGFLAIVVTNQPVIARGECTPQALDEIHRRLETLLGLEGAYLDALYYCPHHPDKGFPGERAEYKIPCRCRKPATGMIDKAAEEFNIDISSSYLAGDTLTDIETAKNAGCRPVFIHFGAGVLPPENVAEFESLKQFTDTLTGR